MDGSHYNNALFTLSETSTPDPYVTFAHGKYWMTFTAEGNRVEIWSSDDLLSLGTKGARQVVWYPPPDTQYSADIWAPELHEVYGRWFIYFAAASRTDGNKSHRMYVLGGPPSNTPPVSSHSNNHAWEFLGLVEGLPRDNWGIDGTVFTLNSHLYFVYSGWPLYNPNLSDLIQELFIVELADATHATGSPIQISQPSLPWEHTEHHGIQEGPQFLSSPDGSWIGIAYSCAGSWTADYKVNTLRYVGGNPLSAQAWQKSSRPLLQRRDSVGPFGPGHGSFVNVKGETLMVFHATDRDNSGWEGRKGRVQRVGWGQKGPEMGDGKVGRRVSDENTFWELQMRKKRRRFRGLIDGIFRDN